MFGGVSWKQLSSVSMKISQYFEFGFRESYGGIFVATLLDLS